MLSHESVPLIIIFIIMLLGIVATALHPLHALITWFRRQNEESPTRPASKAESY
ncbi:hypothetical protein SAMN03159390_00645 [Pseudomonas sp. NFACC49-2]|nr:hypothetical protein SAMN03159390_00645 [Pseudomonas sp. NFACC49-2]